MEPANPIRVYLDRTLSSESRTPGRNASRSRMEPVLRSCRIQDALQVQNGQPEVTVAYHQIVYSYAMGNTILTN